MSTNLPIKTTIGRLPLNYENTPKNMFKEMIRRMRIRTDGVITGQDGGSEPSSNIGMWVNGTTIYLWDRTAGGYSPQSITVEDNDFTVTTGGVSEPLTANHDVDFPDAAGVVALLGDIFIPRLPATPDDTGATFTVNGDLFEQFVATLHTDTTIVITGFPDGKMLTFLIFNEGSSWTLTWPGAIEWAGGGEPTQPTTGSGGTGIGIYRLRSINGTIYGVAELSTTGPVASVVTSPAVPRNYGNSGNIPRAEYQKNLL